MAETDTLMAEAIELLRARAENTDLALSYATMPVYWQPQAGKVANGRMPWHAAACNDVGSVALGEAEGVYNGWGFTPEQALQALLADMRPGVRSQQRDLCDNSGHPVTLPPEAKA